MKLSCSLFLTMFLLFFSFTMSAQANKVVHQLLPIDATCSNVNLNFDTDDVVIYRTAGSRIQLEMTISIGSPNAKMLDFLVAQGRYDILTTADAETATFNIGHKQINAKMILQGKECTESFKYVVYIPASIKSVTINELELDQQTTAVAKK